MMGIQDQKTASSGYERRKEMCYKCSKEIATVVVSHHEIPPTKASRTGLNQMLAWDICRCCPVFQKLIDRGIGVHQFVQGQGSKALKRRAENSRSSMEVYWTVG